MNTAKIEKLLSDIKNYLDITWEDPMGDQKLKGIIQRGMATLQGKIGECDFSGETPERALLFDYVMYARAGEIPQFFANYKSEIISLQIDRKVERYSTDQIETV